VTEGQPPAQEPAAGQPPAQEPPAGEPPVQMAAERKPAEGKPAGERVPVGQVTGETPPDQVPPADPAALAGSERLSEQVVRTGMFGVHGTPDTSGYGGLKVRRPPPLPSPRPYGSYFDDVAEALGSSLEQSVLSFGDAVERVVVQNGDLTFHIRREHLPAVARRLRDDPALAFELCTGVSGVHYLADPGRELHAVYHLLSLTHNRRLRLEVSVPDADPHIPSMVDIYPTCDWHERETWDFFGIIFDGHPALTRIQMPDDWKGHPQRKDYPLGGIPVEYRGATVPPPEERRSYE
jgi:NADH-quinone oxidoreductase subunit C